MTMSEAAGSAVETTSTTPAQTAVSTARQERGENFILVSLERTPRLYSRVAKRILMGRDGKEAFDELSVSGLGMATKVAIGTAALLESEGCVTIEKVETSYFASARRKYVPKITIVCRKTKDFLAIMEREKEKNAANGEETVNNNNTNDTTNANNTNNNTNNTNTNANNTNTNQQQTQPEPVKA